VGDGLALVSPDGVAPSRMVDVSASVNLPLHHKVQKFSSGTAHPGGPWEERRKTVVVVCGGLLYTVSQNNVPPLACCNFDTHEWILIFFGRNVTDKVGNQKTLYYVISNNLCFCTTRTWQRNTKITFFTQLHCVTRTMHLCAVFLKEKIVICDVFDSV